jgi:PAS domain S-box-containing protein
MKKKSIAFSFEQFNKLFPFYILINHQLVIQSFGKSLSKICICEGQPLFTSVFNLKRPELGDLDFEGLKFLIGQMIILESIGDNPFLLRGQFDYLPDQDQILFVGSPWFDSVNEIKERKLTIPDFAIHNPMIDLLHILKTQQIATDEIKELLSTINRQKNTLRGINEFAANLLKQVTLEEIAWTIVESAIRRFNLEDCVIYLIDEGEQYLIQRAAYGDKQSEGRNVLNPIKIKIGEGIVGKVAQSGKPLMINDTSIVPEYIVDDKLRYSELSVPIIADDKVIGIIDSEHSMKNFFTKQHLSDVTTIANLAAIRIKNAITQEKKTQVERALEENRQRFEELIERAGEILYELNNKGNYTYANSVFFKKTGYSIEELKEKHYLELVEEGYREKVKTFYHNQFTDQIRETYFEMPVITNNGTKIWIGQNVTFGFKEDGNLKDIIAVARDITGKKLAEIALKRSEEKYRGIIENMQLGILEVDLEERIKYVNGSFCKMSGFSSDELTGKIARKILLVKEGHKKMVKINERRKNGFSHAYEIETKNKKNEPKWWLVSAGPSYDNSGNIIGSIGIHLDITKHKKLEKELKKAKQVAEDSAKAKEYFLANMSHEIRTPLNAILGMLRELSKGKLNKKESNYTSNARTAAEHLLSIINNILDVSKIEAGQFKLEKRHFKLSKIFDSIKKIMSIKANEKGLDLVINFSDEIKPAHIGDTIRIRQILINLVGNAIKFTEKGNVTLYCEAKSTNNNNQLLHISIADTGIGIDEAYLKNLFNKFSQEDNSTSRIYGGTGLGMAITFDLVQLMGGTINASSKKGEGTRIEIELPLPIGNVKKTIEETTTLDYSQLKNKRILLVEDNPMNRLVTKATLSHYNVHITEAENGKEAIEKVKSEPFDIILMDIQMPVMDGIQATKIIRSELKIQTPIIALTANAFKKQIDLCLSVGMDAYVAKPVIESTFLQTLLKVSQQKTIDLQNDNQSSNPAIKKDYDLSALKIISRGNEEFVNKMIRLFIKTIPSSLQTMKKAFQEKDFKTLQAIAHRIKPSINDMGITDITDEIKQIELLALEDPHSDALPRLLEKTEKVLDKVIDQMKKEVD